MTTNKADIQDFLYPKKGHLWLQEWITHPFRNCSCTLQNTYFLQWFCKGAEICFPQEGEKEEGKSS